MLRLTYDLDISPGSVTGGLKHLAPLFEPLYQGIIAQNLLASHWHADETRWRVFVGLEGKQGHKWYLWVFCSATTVVFKLAPSRSAAVLNEHFGQEAEGIISADRYSAYKVLLKEGRLLIAFCWAHVRRDFLSVALDWPKLESWAFGWVDRIGALYRLNDERVSVLNEPEEFGKADAKVREAVREMNLQLQTERSDSKLNPVSKKVLESLHKHWSGLILFVDHPEIPMDNNTAERTLRNPVVGRKSYYGSGAVWSGMLAAMLFSLFQTLLLGNINPRLWLDAYFEACAQNGGEAPDNATQWLPWNLREDQRSRFQIAGRSENAPS
jgi:transposase